jgi:hypothetical protein
LLTMVVNVVSNYLCGHFVAHCSHKVSVFPKLSTPQVFFYLMVLREYYARTDALQHPYHSGNGVPRRKGQNDMDMVLCDLKGRSICNRKNLFPPCGLTNLPSPFFSEGGEAHIWDPLSPHKGSRQWTVRYPGL